MEMHCRVCYLFDFDLKIRSGQVCLAFIWGIIFFCTMDVFFQNLRKEAVWTNMHRAVVYGPDMGSPLSGTYLSVSKQITVIRFQIPSNNLKGLKNRSTIRCASWNLPRLTRLILMGMFAYTCLHITGQIDDTDHYLSKKKVLSTWVAKRAQKK